MLFIAMTCNYIFCCFRSSYYMHCIAMTCNYIFCFRSSSKRISLSHKLWR